MRFVFALLFIVGMVGCRKKTETASTEKVDAEQRVALAPVIEKHRAATTKWFEARAAIGKDAKAAPPVTEMREPLSATVTYDPKTILIGRPGWFADDSPDVPDPGAQYFYNPEVPISNLKSMLATGLWTEGGYLMPVVEKTFATIEKYRYAAVVRVHTSSPAKAMADSFVGATAAGDVILYTLPDAKRIGAFRFKREQQLDKILLSNKENQDEAIQIKFRSELSRMLDDALKAYLSGTAEVESPPP